MNYVLSLGREIIEKRKLIWDLGKADFRKRFVGSYFGIVWMFIQPIVTNCHLCNHLWTCGFQDASASAGGFLCGLAGSGHRALVFLQRGAEYGYQLPAGI